MRVLLIVSRTTKRAEDARARVIGLRCNSLAFFYFFQAAGVKSNAMMQSLSDARQTTTGVGTIDRRNQYISVVFSTPVAVAAVTLSPLTIDRFGSVEPISLNFFVSAVGRCDPMNVTDALSK